MSKFPTIPEFVNTPEEMSSALRAVKQAVEILAGLRQGEPKGSPQVFLQPIIPKTSLTITYKPGDFWINSADGSINYWTGSQWKPTPESVKFKISEYTPTSASPDSLVLLSQEFTAWSGGGYAASMPGITVQHFNEPYKFSLISGYHDNLSGPGGTDFCEVNIGDVAGDTSAGGAYRNPQIVNINTSREDKLGFRRRASWDIDGSFRTNIEGYPGVSPSTLNAYPLYPAYFCRAWVNFNGTGTIAIRASGNVSSITDFDVGYYGVNLTTAMPDTDYVPFVMNWDLAYFRWARPGTASQFEVFVGGSTGPGDAIDDPTIYCAIFR
jgi:hypothetical protein